MQKYILFILLFFSINIQAGKHNNLKESIIEARSNIEQIYNINHIKENHNNFSVVHIDNQVINPPTNKDDINRYLKEIKTTLQSKTTDTVVFQYAEEQPMKLKLPALGMGKHGIVFTIADDQNKQDKVIKLNILDNIRGIVTAQKEAYNYVFWNEKVNRHTFSVTKMHYSHPLGIYSIKEKNKGISLTEFLVKKELIFVTNVKEYITDFHKFTEEYSSDAEINKVFTAIFEILNIIKNNPENSVNFSSANIFINYDKEKNIDNIELIDYGITKNIDKVVKYYHMKTWNDYLNIAAERLAKDLKNAATIRFTPKEFIQRLNDNNLPNSMIKVNDNLKIENNHNITTFPENVRVEGNLTIENCMNLNKIHKITAEELHLINTPATDIQDVNCSIVVTCSQ